MRGRLAPLALAQLLLVLLVACGGGGADTEDGTASGASSPPQTEAAGTEAASDGPVATDDWDAVVEAAREEGFVNVDFVTNAEEVAQIADLWAEAYPDIELRSRQDVSGPMASIEEEEVSAGRAEFDVVMNAAPAFLLRWQAEGRMTDVTDLPFYAELPEPYQQGDYAFAYFGVFTLLVNTDSVSPEEYPASYEELLEPEWAGRTGIADPATGAGSTKIATYVLHEAYGMDFFEQLAQNQPVLFDNVLNGGQAVASGEVDAFIAGSTITVTQLADQGAPIAVAPLPNSSPVMAAFFIYSETEQPNAARVFLNWVIGSPEMQEFFRSTARIPPELWPEDGEADFSSVHPAYAGLTPEDVRFPDLQAYAEAVDAGLMEDISAAIGF